jgi:hypothetical protein
MARWFGNRISNYNSTPGEHESKLSLFAPERKEAAVHCELVPGTCLR